MSHLELDSPIVRLGDHRREPLGLKVIEWIVWNIATDQMGHDAAQVDGLGGDGGLQGGQYRGIVPGAHTVAVQSGVHLDGDTGGPAGLLDRGKQILDLPDRGHPDLHVGVQRRREIGSRRM